jgi:biotin carboxyl carrier protein
MNSALRLRSIPVLLLRRRYGAMATLSKQLEPSFGVPVASTSRQWASSKLQTTSRRHLHSTVVLHKEYPAHTIHPMPALSPTQETGTIAKWEVKEGDSVSAGSVFCSVETDKATMDFECQDDGFVAKILRDGPNAIDIPCGTPILVVVEEEEDVAAFADFVLAEEAPAAAIAAESSEPAAAETPAASGTLSDQHVLLPSARFLAESKYVFPFSYSSILSGYRV